MRMKVFLFVFFYFLLFYSQIQLSFTSWIYRIDVCFVVFDWMKKKMQITWMTNIVCKFLLFSCFMHHLLWLIGKCVNFFFFPFILYPFSGNFCCCRCCHVYVRALKIKLKLINEMNERTKKIRISTVIIISVNSKTSSSSSSFINNQHR